MKVKKPILLVLMVTITIAFFIGMEERPAMALDTWDGSIASEYLGGSGSEADPYQIATGAQLAYLAQQVNNGDTYAGIFFMLMDDIDLNNLQWTPIGNGVNATGNYYIRSDGFGGTFWGDGHTISNLQVSISGGGTSSTRRPGGFFGHTKATSRIDKLILRNVNVSSNANSDNYIGGLMGEGEGIFTNCSVVGGVGVCSNGLRNTVGGLVGMLWSEGRIINCYTNVPVTASTGEAFAGGLVGCCGGGNSLVSNCYTRGNISCTTVYYGGMVGENYSNISNCYSTGTANGLKAPISHNVAIPTFDVVANSAFYLADSDGNPAPAGYSGTTATDATMKSDNFVTTLNINRSCVSGLIPPNIILYDWLKDTANLNDGYPIFIAPLADDVTTGVPADAAAVYSGGSGTPGDPYLISTADDLIQFAVNVNSGAIDTTGKYYKITQDIDLEGGIWTPIGTKLTTGLKGHFDFNNKIVSNYTIKPGITITTNYGGLFGFINGGTVTGYVAPISDFANSGKTSSTASFTWTAAIEATNIIMQQSPTGANTWSTANTGVIANNAATATVTGLSAGSGYDFRLVVTGGSNAGNSNTVSVTTTGIPSSGRRHETNINTGVDILVNGRAENAGTATLGKKGNQTVITVDVDPEKLERKLETEGNNAVVTIPFNTDTDVVVGQLNGQMVKNMEDKQAVLEIRTDTASYILPAQQINIEDISQQIGSLVELKDITVKVEIAESPAATARIVEDSCEKGQYTIVAPPMDFEVTCTCQNKIVNVSKFNIFVERIMAIPPGIDPTKITTGVALNNDGTVSHVPTKVVIIDGKYFAKINSLTNSTYSVIWHPKTFDDMENHWAQLNVNQMGSRLVIKGIDENHFEPGRDITRAEFAAMVARALGLREGRPQNKFSDVSENDWFFEAVNTASDYNLINGYQDGTFKPDHAITREEAMEIIARAIEIAGIDINLSASDINTHLADFGDRNNVGEWAKKSVAACVKHQTVIGKNGCLAPKDNITRAETAAIVVRMLQNADLI